MPLPGGHKVAGNADKNLPDGEFIVSGTNFGPISDAMANDLSG